MLPAWGANEIHCVSYVSWPYATSTMQNVTGSRVSELTCSAPPMGHHGMPRFALMLGLLRRHSRSVLS